MIEITGKENQSRKLKYLTQQISLADLPVAPWLKEISKEQSIYLVGDDDKELVLALVALRMLGYDAIAAVEK